MTVHYISEDDKLTSSLLDCFTYNERHTAENITAVVKTVCEQWHIFDKITAMVTDNAAKMIDASKTLGFTHTLCFVHTLNLIIQNAIAEIKPLHCNVKAVVEYFKRISHIKNYPNTNEFA